MAEFLLRAALIGAGATALLDLWNILLNRTLGLPLPNWGMIGRWFCHLPSGTLAHESIGASPGFSYELPAGWVAHYAVGILFAAALMVIWPGWARAPTLLPGLIVGWVTILCGWLILAPGMGAGIAASKTPNPTRARLMNLAGHTVFGFGLWGTALLTRGWF